MTMWKMPNIVSHFTQMQNYTKIHFHHSQMTFMYKLENECLKYWKRINIIHCWWEYNSFHFREKQTTGKMAL